MSRVNPDRPEERQLSIDSIAVAGLLLLGALAASCSSLRVAPPSAETTPEPRGATQALPDEQLDPARPSGTAEQAAALPAFTPTPPPFNLATPAIVIERPEAAPSATPESSTLVLPSASIRILRPGPASQVTSPFQVYGRAGPSNNERVWIRLIGEDGREIAKRLTYLLVYPGRAGNFVASIEFDTPMVAEAARLEVSTEDPRYGRMDQMASINLTLLSVGSPRVHPGLEGPQKLAIFQPREGAFVEGDTLYVRGGGWVDSDQPIVIELLDRGGSVLASQMVEIQSPQVGQLGAFEAQLRFELPFSQYARLAVYEQGQDIPGMVYYTSVELWLQR